MNKLFKRMNFEKLSETLATKEIEWRFNPPTAAWWGGFWERLIGVLKRLLRQTLKQTCLNYEEMLTVLLDCEAIINSRPITFMSENDHDVVPLTPCMFSQEVKEIDVIELDEIERVQFDKRYLYRQRVKDDLRHRFRNEYLGALSNQSTRKPKSNKVINVGNIVLIGSENVKRLNWPLARVKNIIFGKDNNVRLVRLITKNGELIRPVQRIFPLELQQDNNLESQYNDIVIEKLKIKNELRVKSKNVDRYEDDLNLENKTDKIVTTKSGRVVKKPNRLMYV